MSDVSLAPFGNPLKYFYEYWNNDSPNDFGVKFGFQYVPKDKKQILCFHGNKYLDIADECIQFVKLKKYGIYNSRYFFIDKYKIHKFKDNGFLYKKNDELYLKYSDNTLFEYKDFNYLKPNDIVIDVGSDIGFFERHAYLKQASKIICFEPDKTKFELLKLNVNPNTILFNAEIIDETGYKNEQSINTFSINYLFETKLFEHIDFLKIDNKGKEFKILNISDNNFKKINRISVKYYHLYHNNDKDLRQNFIKSITKHGFYSWNHMVDDISYIHFRKK